MSATTPAPIPAAELRDAALLARVCLLLASARAYGLVEGGPEVDVQRCEEILELAREAGIELAADEVDEALAQFVAELARGGGS